MIEINGLKSVILSLRSKENYPQARNLLDHFLTQASCIQDYNMLGECAVLSQYHELRLLCAKYVYTHVTTSQQLFLARENLYQCYNALNYPETALFYIELNLKIKPNDPETLLHKSFNLALMGLHQEASAILELIELPDDRLRASLAAAQSSKLLREGKLAQGVIAFTSADKPINHLFENCLKLKFWDGIVQPGKTIVINSEGGIGDELINIRFLDNLKKLGMYPILYSSWHSHRPDIVKLFKRHGYTVVTNTLFFKPDYLWTHMMSLPGYLGLSESQVWRGAYLHPLKQRKNKLIDTNFKIGIKCNGNPHFEQDIYRTIPIAEMVGIMPENASIYHFGIETEYPGIISLKDRINSWDDTLDFIDQMDIIVSSCTSVVHAAGAIGKRTIVIVPIAKYYVWTSSNIDNTSPWYGDNFTVLSQTVVRSWQEPLAQAKLLVHAEYKNFRCINGKSALPNNCI